MSVTITVAEFTAESLEVFCLRDNQVLATVVAYEDADPIVTEHEAATVDTHGGQCAIIEEVLPFPEVNVTGSSMMFLGRAANLPTDEHASGTLPGAEFHARVVRAQQGLPAHEPAPFRAGITVHDEAYLVRQLHVMEQLGRWAKDHDKTVIWG